MLRVANIVKYHPAAVETRGSAGEQYQCKPIAWAAANIKESRQDVGDGGKHIGDANKFEIGPRSILHDEINEERCANASRPAPSGSSR